MNRAQITQVEVHVTHACNFICQGCTHFSQEMHAGRETPQSFRDMIEPWGERIAPRFVLLLGGEPTLNPDLVDIIPIAREVFPETMLRLVTNGWFLHRHKGLAETLRTNKCRLDVSIHDDEPEYVAKLAEIKGWAESEGLDFDFRESFRDWTAYYRGNGPTALPFDDRDPQSSWKICPSKWCFNIHEGKLWKCPMAAYVPMHVKKHGSGPRGEWVPYLRYRPLEPTCTDTELIEFVNRRCEPNLCSMCSAIPRPLKKHLVIR